MRDGNKYTKQTIEVNVERKKMKKYQCYFDGKGQQWSIDVPVYVFDAHHSMTFR